MLLIRMSADKATTLLNRMITRVRDKSSNSCAAVVTACMLEAVPDDDGELLLNDYRTHSDARVTCLGFKDIPADDWEEMTSLERINIRIDRLTAWMNDAFIRQATNTEQVMAVHVVYWTENGQPHSAPFPDGALHEMLNFTQSLRKRQYADGTVSFVASASEHPQSVGKLGVDVTSADYDWKKRRI